MTVSQIGPGTLPASNGREERRLDEDDVVCIWFPGQARNWFSELQFEVFKRWTLRHCSSVESEQGPQTRDGISESDKMPASNSQ